jgi:hypothetical protein
MRLGNRNGGVWAVAFTTDTPQIRALGGGRNMTELIALGAIAILAAIVLAVSWGLEKL